MALRHVRTHPRRKRLPYDLLENPSHPLPPRQRIVTFMEMRHHLAVARLHDETELVEKITKANKFYVPRAALSSPCLPRKFYVILVRNENLPHMGWQSVC